LVLFRLSAAAGFPQGYAAPAWPFDGRPASAIQPGEKQFDKFVG
jgi:hypothetical protein